MSIKDEVKKIIDEKISEADWSEMIEKAAVKAFEDSVSDIFGCYGNVTKAIKSRLEEVILPAVEGYDYSRYIPKIDTLLTEIINNTSLCENEKILGNFKELMLEPDKMEISMSELFHMYCKYVAEYVDTSALSVQYEDEVHYEPVEVSYEVEYEDEYRYSRHACVKFKCIEDENLDKIIHLCNWGDGKWRIINGIHARIESIRYLDNFDVAVLRFSRANAAIEIDEEYGCGSVEPDKEPELTYE